NGRKDWDEPGLAGVRISIGPFETHTTRDGQFSFRQRVPAGLPVRLDIGSLAGGYLAPSSELPLPAEHRIAIPVVRAAILDLFVFKDLNGDGFRDADEPPLPNATLVLKESAGRFFPRQTD